MEYNNLARSRLIENANIYPTGCGSDPASLRFLTFYASTMFGRVA